MNRSFEEDDVISRLLNNTSSLSNNNCCTKSLHDEFLEIGAFSSSNRTKASSCSSKKDNTNTNNKSNKKSKLLTTFIHEFQLLSNAMDCELIHCKTRSVKEQKESNDGDVHGKVDVLKKILLTQIDENRKLEMNFENTIYNIKDEYEEKFKKLRSDLQHYINDSSELQITFNNSLDKKEQEIENLISENTGLRHELTALKSDCVELSTENEELESKIEIKDDCITSLRLQIKVLEHRRQQDVWRLDQEEELLEIVEKERDAIEQKLKGLNVTNAHYKDSEAISLETVENKSSDKRLNNFKTHLVSRKAGPLREIPVVFQSLGWSKTSILGQK